MSNPGFCISVAQWDLQGRVVREPNDSRQANYVDKFNVLVKTRKHNIMPVCVCWVSVTRTSVKVAPKEDPPFTFAPWLRGCSGETVAAASAGFNSDGAVHGGALGWGGVMGQLSPATKPGGGSHTDQGPSGSVTGGPSGAPSARLDGQFQP